MRSDRVSNLGYRRHRFFFVFLNVLGLPGKPFASHTSVRQAERIESTV